MPKTPVATAHRIPEPVDQAASREAQCSICGRAIGVVHGRLPRHKVGGAWCRGSGEVANEAPNGEAAQLAGAALPLDPTWDEAIAHWLANARGRGGGYAELTKRRYLRLLGVVREWMETAGATKPSQVDEALAARWLASRFDGGSTQGRPAAKVINAASVFRSFHAHLRAHVSLPLPDLTDCLRLRGHGTSRQHHEPMREADVQRAMWWMTHNAHTLRDRLCAAVLALGLCLGLRRREIFKLLIGHVDLERGRLHVTDGKGGRDRWLPVPPGVRDVLGRYLSHSGGVDPARQFLRSPRTDGHYRNDREVHRISAKAQKLAGVRQPVCLHGLRHTAARLFYERSGRDLRATQHFLGHASADTTIEYLDEVTIGDLEGAVPDLDMFADAA